MTAYAANVSRLSDEALDAMIRAHFAEHSPILRNDRRKEGDRRAMARWNEQDRRQP